LKNSTRTGWWREMAPLLCWLIDETQLGSAGAERGFSWMAESPLHEMHRNATAASSVAAKRSRIMKAPREG
jgi:hypothetical protein